MDDIDINEEEGVVVHKGRFIEKNKKKDRVMEKHCKRCNTVLTIYENDQGDFKLWCISCDSIGLSK